MPRQYNRSIDDASMPGDIKKFYSHSYCTSDQIKQEQDAWKDAGLYAKALASWQVNGSYQEAMDLYMGTDTRGPLGEIVEGMCLGGNGALICTFS